VITGPRAGVRRYKSTRGHGEMVAGDIGRRTQEKRSGEERIVFLGK
jgi:hypothetical protein